MKVISTKKLAVLLFSLAFIFNISIVKSQRVEGHVFSLDSLGNKIPVHNAYVFLSKSQTVTLTDTLGWYTINKSLKGNTCLMASFVGFRPDSFLVTESNGIINKDFILKEIAQIQEVFVTGQSKGTLFAKSDIFKTEQITTTGLMKMACCNLSESFENSASITTSHTDAVSGSKQVQLLGLSSIYSQVLGENLPIMRGLASSFGWNYTPGSWLESIQISKGTSSVLNGYESITGQINLEYKKPNKVEDFYADLYTDYHNRYELNVTGSRKVRENLWTNLFVNVSAATWDNLILKNSSTNNFHDRNGDHFMDMPKTKLVNVFNRWLYESPSKRLQSRSGFQYLYEDRFGGQSPQCHKADMYYTTDVVNENLYLYNKTGIAIGDKPGQSLGITNSFTDYKLESLYGPNETYKLFYGYQKSFNSNVLFNSYLGNTNHLYTLGVSFLHDNFETYFRDKLPENNTPLTSLNRIEYVAGGMGQYTYKLSKLTLIVGIREDYNSKFGWLFTPRTNVRYGVNDNLILRASAGCGYRSPNVLAENLGLMVSTRKFDISQIEGLKIEKAWNYGASATFYYTVWNNERLVLSVDYFHTDFMNLAIVDQDRDINSLFFYNSSAKNYTNAIQTDLSLTVVRGFDISAAFRYNRSWLTLTDGTNSYLVEKPLYSKYRGLLNLSYATKFRKWVFDYTLQVNGPCRIPSTNGYQSQPTYSPYYPLHFIQVTKNTKRFDMFLGVENLLDFRQANPIINAENPFVKGFDASQIWGPLMGRKIYLGFRLRLGKMY